MKNQDDDYDDESNEIHPHDMHPSNVLVRAGYILGMAQHSPPGDDRKFLMQASKSLRAYALKLQEEDACSREKT